MENSEKRDRRRLIEGIVDRWVEKNKDVLASFGEAVKEMRQGRAPENQAMSYRATLPGDLMRQLDFALSSEGGARPFDPEGELEWFAKTYPEFIIPYER